MKRNASALWKGGLNDGRGSLTTQSGVLSDTQYSFSTRFEDGKGTNPEELTCVTCVTSAPTAAWPRNS